MKSEFYVEFNGNKVAIKVIEDAFKEMWKEKGGKIKELGNVEFYYKPEDNTCYYVVTGTEEKGRIDF